MSAVVGLIVDGAPGAYHRDVSDFAIRTAILSTGVDVQAEVVPTATLAGRTLEEFAAVMVGPGSPYDDPETVIDWIRSARERGVPLVGT